MRSNRWKRRDQRRSKSDLFSVIYLLSLNMSNKATASKKKVDSEKFY